jgi:hypothetical protein
MWIKATLFNNEEAKDWCKSRGVAINKAQGEGVDSAGGFLVPEELMANIIVLREQFGVFRQECQIVPMGSDTLNWPRRTGGLTASFTGENQSATESTASWDNINLTAKKLAVLSRMSTEIEQDAVVAIADWLVGEMAYAFAGRKMIAASTVRHVDLWRHARHHRDCGGLQHTTGKVPDLCQRDLRFDRPEGLHQHDGPSAAVRHRQCQVVYVAAVLLLGCRQPAGGAGGNRLDILSQGIEKRLLGFPVVIAQKMPITAPGSGLVQCHFGDLTKAAMMGERRGVTIKRSDHRYFENDQIGLLGTERFDINVHDMGDTSVAGPLVSMVSP